MNSVTIELPLPPKELSPNARVHWRKKSEAVKNYRLHSFVASYQGKHNPRWPAATTQATFYFKHKRRRDKDNFNAMLKSAWDGMVDAGLLKDDDQLTHKPTVFETDKDNPRVEITITKG